MKDLWEEFIGPLNLCGLCGNTGVIDTIGKVFSPAGYHAGVQAFCICPNGRAWKRQKVDLKALCARAQRGEATLPRNPIVDNLAAVRE